MKKCTFYSLMRKDNRTQAVKHEGYTDGVYNYYNNGSARYPHWFAIEPSTGLSVVSDYTRKATAEQAHKRAEAVKETLKRKADVAAQLATLRAEAEAAQYV